MANLALGPLLSGLAQGYTNYQSSQEDLAYLRQTRQLDIAGKQLQGAQQQIALSNAQQQQQDDQATRAAALAAWQQTQSGAQGANGQPAPDTPQPSQDPAQQAATPVAGQLPALQKAGMTIAQLNDYAQKHDLPPDLVYGFLSSESGGDKNAVSPKGAVGLMQSMPSTAANPGYGVKPYDPNSVDGSLDYLSAMYKKAGGDPAKTAAMWNAGPQGDPSNPETKKFTSNVLQNAQAYKLASAADQSATQPTPADQLSARLDAGLKTPPTVAQQLLQQQQQQVKQLMQASQIAMKNGNPVVAAKFSAQAAELQKSTDDMAGKTLDIQKKANAETSTLAAGVEDQDSYNNLQSQIKDNPAMQAAVRGLNLTGDYETDKPKLATLADRSVTLKDQQDLQIRKQELQLKQSKEQRDQAKEDAPILRQQAAQQADAARQKVQTAQGVPFAPSLAAQMEGATPAQIAQQKAKVSAMRNTFVTKTLTPATQAGQQVDLFSKQIIGLLDPKSGSVTTGGWGRIPLVGATMTGLEPSRQQFEKAGNNLVTQMQQALAAVGEGRSAGTAAMAKIISTTKPNLDVSPATNREIVNEIYTTTQLAVNQAQFTGEYLRANPDATPSAAQLEWARYENSIGPMAYEDSASPTRLRFNSAVNKNNPDGTPNPGYKDWHQFFKDNP